MRKTYLLAILASVVIMMAAFAFADGEVSAQGGDWPKCGVERTIVAGSIYEAGGNPNDDPVSSANVQVTCHAEEEDVVKSTTSNSAGHYEVDFKGSKCDFGDSVTVKAWKGDMTGEEEGTIEYEINFGCGCKVNIGVVDVPLIPEFGLIIGSLTIVGALVAFMVIRRH